jgi:NADH dehydrogenase
VDDPKKTIVIVGGGFAGVYAARYLRRRLGPAWEIVLFSEENHFIFTPLLGDVVGSSINPMHVVWPIRQMARGAICRTAAIASIDLAAGFVEYDAGRPTRQRFDHLLLCPGSAVNLDIIPGMAAHGWPLKTMGDALMLRNRLIGQLEKAEVETDPEARRRLLSVVVVGGGYSGVEVAGEIKDLLAASARFYPTIQPSDIRVSLLEGRDRILSELPITLSAFATTKMAKAGIAIECGAQAQAVTDLGVRLKDGREISASVVVCTIGTTVRPLIRDLGLPMVGNRLKVGGDMRVEGRTNVWSLGDAAAVPNAYDNKPSPPTAQFALRQAKQLAANLAEAIAGRQARAFSFRPQGMLASIGNHKAVGLVFGIRVSGFLAWFLWRGVYLGKMPSLARKVQIAFDWAWQLFFPRDLVELSLGQTERFGRAHFEAGQFVFRRGDPGDKFYVVERGSAQVFLAEDGPCVAEMKKGEHFGEGSLLGNNERSATMKAGTDGLDVLMVGRESFAKLTKHLDVLRTALQRTSEGSRSAARLLDVARDHPHLNRLHVQDLMSRPVTTLAVGLTFGEALEQGQTLHKGAYPVVDAAGKMVGIVTRTDYYRAANRMLAPTTPLSEIMKSPVITVRASDTLTAALVHFAREPIKRLVVVADDDPALAVGMLTPFDVLRALAEKPAPAVS